MPSESDARITPTTMTANQATSPENGTPSQNTADAVSAAATADPTQQIGGALAEQDLRRRQRPDPEELEQTGAPVTHERQRGEREGEMLQQQRQGGRREVVGRVDVGIDHARRVDRERPDQHRRVDRRHLADRFGQRRRVVVERSRVERLAARWPASRSCSTVARGIEQAGRVGRIRGEASEQIDRTVDHRVEIVELALDGPEQFGDRRIGGIPLVDVGGNTHELVR